MLKTYLDFKLVGYFHFHSNFHFILVILQNPLGYFSKYIYSNISPETVMQLRQTEKGSECRNCTTK